MKLVALLLLATLESWGVQIISSSEAVIINDLNKSIICYVYYDDGDFKKLKVRANSESRPFSRDGLIEVECF